MSKKQKWMASGFEQSTTTGIVDEEKGVIRGVSVCTVGEAKGHGVMLDAEFVKTVCDMGNEKKQGLKARFGHPNMCSTALGTFIGRFKNFELDENQVRADLFVSNSCKEAPGGDLHKYLFELANTEPDMFGTSIVFTPGFDYKRDKDGDKIYPPNYKASPEDYEKQCEAWNEAGESVFVECDALHACDCVDDPAANEGGLFSAFGNATVAGQITEFLDLNPQIWDALENNPSILEALSQYGDKMDEFTTRYRETRKLTKEAEMSEQEQTAETVETVEELDATETTEVVEEQEESMEETAETAETETVEEAVEESTEETETTEEELESLSRDDFLQVVEEFGADIAAQTVKENGSYESALKLHADQLKAEVEQLKAENKGLKAGKNGTPLKVKSAPDGKKSGGFFKGRMPEDRK